MIYDSLQGTRLSPGQRARLEQERHMRSFLNPVLAEQVAETLKALEVRKEQGAKPEKLWVLVSESRGTTCIAEWMGF